MTLMTNDLNDPYFYCVNNQRVMLLKEPCFKSCKLLSSALHAAL